MGLSFSDSAVPKRISVHPSPLLGIGFAALLSACAIHPSTSNDQAGQSAIKNDGAQTSGSNTAGNAPQDGIDWLTYVNGYRTASGLSRLEEDVALSEADRIHARYIVESDTIAHAEDPTSPYYTATGDEAGRTSNVAGGTNMSTPSIAIDAWMAAPFHAVGILDPSLQTVGYGEYYDATKTGLRFGAAMDVIHGRTGGAWLGDDDDGTGNEEAKPGDGVQFPAAGGVVALHKGSREIPDPLSGCKGYAEPTGLPIVLELAHGRITKVKSTALSTKGVALDHCMVDAWSYSNPDPLAEAEVRAVLAARRAIVLIPKAPLVPGSTYAVKVNANGRVFDWSFTVAATVRD